MSRTPHSPLRHRDDAQADDFVVEPLVLELDELEPDDPDPDPEEDEPDDPDELFSPEPDDEPDDEPDVASDFVSEDFESLDEPSEELPEDSEDPDVPEPDERLSLWYQPLPLKTIPTDENTLRSRPPHSGHSVSDGSLNAWTCSKRWSQAVQA